MRFAAQTKPETGVKAHRTRSARMHWIWYRDSSKVCNSAGGNAAADGSASRGSKLRPFHDKTLIVGEF